MDSVVPSTGWDYSHRCAERSFQLLQYQLHNASSSFLGAFWKKVPESKEGSPLLESYAFLVNSDFEVDYGSKEHAAIVYAALDVDKELQPDKVKRLTSVSDGKLIVHFKAVEARFLRASFSSLVDLMTLTTKIIEEFGQNGNPLEQK